MVMLKINCFNDGTLSGKRKTIYAVVTTMHTQNIGYKRRKRFFRNSNGVVFSLYEYTVRKPLSRKKVYTAWQPHGTVKAYGTICPMDMSYCVV